MLSVRRLGKMTVAEKVQGPLCCACPAGKGPENGGLGESPADPITPEKPGLHQLHLHTPEKISQNGTKQLTYIF